MQSISTPGDEPAERIRVIRAGVGNTVRMIPVTDVICFEAADKYINVVTAGAEALVRMSMRKLVSRIDAVEFMQVHRGVIVNASHITSAIRDELGHCTLHLRGLSHTVKVSRAFGHLFRPMGSTRGHRLQNRNATPRTGPLNVRSDTGSALRNSYLMCR